MFLGIDLGTSGLRLLLVDEGGQPLGAAEAHYAVAHPHDGWSEQAPADWIAALDEAMAKLGQGHDLSGVRGIGVSGHMHGATLVDAAGVVIRPCILWNDTRSHAEAAALDGVAGVRALSGNIVFPGFTAPKLMWLRSHEPANFARVHKVLLPAAYLNFHLTGDYVADCSDSAGTSWLDSGARDWSPTLLQAGGMRADQMPRLVEGSAPAGVLRADLARRWGMGRGVVVAGGAGDNAAAACGTGVLNAGAGFVSLGTSGVVLAAREGYAPLPQSAVHTFCHAVPGRWYQMGVMLAATDSLNWLARITGQTPAALTAMLGEALIAPGKIRFLPYISGERTPHNDAAIRGAFTGLGADSDLADLTRAVVEGVAFGLRDCAEALITAGARLDHMLAIGGGTGSAYWLKLIATVLNRPLHLPAAGEFGAALGAARLAICAATGADPDTVMTPPAVARTIAPDQTHVAAFDAAFARYRAAYPSMREIQ